MGPNSSSNLALESIAFCINNFNDLPCGEDSLKNGPAATIKFILPAQNITLINNLNKIHF